MHHFRFLPALIVLCACNTQPASLAVEDATVRLPAVPGNPGAAYFTIKGGQKAETLISVTSPVVIRTEMHDSVMKNGVMTMTPIEGGIEVPAGGTLSFAPRGKHVMLYDVKPGAQDSVTLNFTFASGTTLTAPAKVLKAGASEDHAH